MPNSAPPACPSAAASQKPVAKNSSSPGSAAAGCAGNASLGRRFCNFAQSSSHNNGTAFGRMLCCKLRSSTSGGNYTHGDAFEYYNGSALNSLSNIEKSNGLERPARLNRNQFGFDLGAPIIKDRTFIFGLM